MDPLAHKGPRQLLTFAQCLDCPLSLWIVTIMQTMANLGQLLPSFWTIHNKRLLDVMPLWGYLCEHLAVTSLQLFARLSQHLKADARTTRYPSFLGNFIQQSLQQFYSLLLKPLFSEIFWAKRVERLQKPLLIQSSPHCSLTMAFKSLAFCLFSQHCLSAGLAAKSSFVTLSIPYSEMSD